MDDELLSLTANEGDSGRLSASFWRRLAAVEGFASSGKDATMLRVRFLILKFWRELTKAQDVSDSFF